LKRVWLLRSAIGSSKNNYC